MVRVGLRPLSVYALLGLLTFQGLSAVLGGAGLVLNPSGEALRLPPGLLDGSPFDDYFVPGLILLVVLGIIPLIVLAGALRRNRWAWLGSVFVGVSLLIWIGVEILMIGYQARPPLQFIYGVVGLLIVLFTLMPGTRRHLHC